MDPLARRVLSRFITSSTDEVAMEFNTPDALEKYLKDHPKADKSKHTVKKPAEPGSEGGGGAAAKPHALDDLPFDLGGNAVVQKAKGKGATKQDLKAAMDEIDKAADAMAEHESERPEDEADEKKLQAAKDHLFDRFQEAVQKSPDYKTTKTPDYYPQKKPKDYKDSEGAAKIKSQLAPEDLAAAEKMPDADLDKNEAYAHPKIKGLSKSLQDDVKKGKKKVDDLVKTMGNIMKMRSEISEGLMNSKSDEEADGWRFPGRQLYKLWQGYNDALQKMPGGDFARTYKAAVRQVLGR